MPPPPVTPSPHRFILNKPRASQQQQQQKTAFSNTTPFNATPRFSIGPSNATQQQQQHTPGGQRATNSTFLSSSVPASKGRRYEEIVDDDSSDLDLDVRESIETAENQWISDDEDRAAVVEQEEDEDEEDYDLGFLDRDVKRRRLLGYEEMQQLEATQDEDEVMTRVEQVNNNNDEVGNLDDILSSSSLPILSSPPIVTTATTTRTSTAPHNAPPRFILPSTPSTTLTPRAQHHYDQSSTPAPATTGTGTVQTPLPAQQPTFHKPPRFLPPSDATSGGPSPHQGHDPLPEVFSPHRRGQKFLVGGLATEVRSWIMALEHGGGGGAGSSLAATLPGVFGTASTAARAARGSGREEWLFRVAVEEVNGGGRGGVAVAPGMSVVRGRLLMDGVGASNAGAGTGTGTREVKMILAGEGVVEGVQRPKQVIQGSLVGIKGPVWEVSLQGARWGVAVEWKVIG